MNREEFQNHLEEQIRLRENKICVVCFEKIRFFHSTTGTAGHTKCVFNEILKSEESRI